MIKKELRIGEGSGFYFGNSKNRYLLYFKDFLGSSYGKDENYYLNPKQYNSVNMYLNLINEFFHSTLKQENEYDTKYNINQITINMIHIKARSNKILNTFKDHYKNFELNFEEIYGCHNSYRLIVKTNDSVYLLLNYLYVVLVCISLINREHSFFDESLILKLIKCLNIIQSPYIIRYLISSRLLNPKTFHKYKSELEKWNNHKLTLNPSYTTDHRKSFIKNLLNFDHNIIDIGCGEGFYALSFYEMLNKSNKSKMDKSTTDPMDKSTTDPMDKSKTDKLLYYAIDTDKEVLNILNKNIIKDNIDNILTFDNYKDLFDALKLDVYYDIIITEVIEHMGKDDSYNFLIEILNSITFNKLIITTPNYSFNKFYQNINENDLNDNFRHYDHKRELTEKEFCDFMNSILLNFKNKNKYETNFLSIGDSIDYIYCTQGLYLKLLL